jgi:hypothetical protein
MNDIRRAISRPENRSRTIANAATRGPAAPNPCRTRAISTISRSSAIHASPLATQYKTAPAKIIGFRPNASDNGPVNNVPIPIPRTKLVMINCARLGASGVSSAVISGIAGSIESTEKAIVANNIAINAMNSDCEIVGRGAGDAIELS